ncbi:MAG: M15 family metallopeptidase [Actinomycetaceae bacterium]|nr:M15 family metallopeptidase [Arcanobacterium sp.]MDD7505587.1 M15 family metallopeptidase [Actinomycetaceae bacterium]MDY6143794.1 M15 family metallopeptidase [Arcanobacterium sp.]
MAHRPAQPSRRTVDGAALALRARYRKSDGNNAAKERRTLDNNHRKRSLRTLNQYTLAVAIAAAASLAILQGTAPSLAVLPEQGSNTATTASQPGNGTSHGQSSQPRRTTPTKSSPQEVAPDPETEEPASTENTQPPAATLDFEDPSSITALINKTNPVPEDFVPQKLVPLEDYGTPMYGTENLMRPEAAEALGKMHEAATAAGSEFLAYSAYRSIAVQDMLYRQYSAQTNQETTDTFSARPRHSEHHTGLAVDVQDAAAGCQSQTCFQDTASGKWLAEHSWEYGFILRYPQDSAGVTGYKFEPWHFRYIGVDTARAYHDSGATTYEEFLGQPPSPRYG